MSNDNGKQHPLLGTGRPNSVINMDPYIHCEVSETADFPKTIISSYEDMMVLTRIK